MKLLFGYGNIDYRGKNNKTDNLSRFMTGSEDDNIRVARLNRFSIRVDYEYQYFPSFWVNGNYADRWVPGTPKSEPPIDPQGFTIGVLYHFSHPHPTD